MGLIDTIKNLFGKRKDGLGDPRAALDAVKLAVQNGDYDDASIKAFYAFEELAMVSLEKPREEAQTAREYVAMVLEEITLPKEDIMPLVYAFEIAKYSPESVTADQFLKADEALKLFEGRVKTQGSRKGKESGRKPRKRQRGTATAARRRRKRRTGRRTQGGE